MKYFFLILLFSQSLVASSVLEDSIQAAQAKKDWRQVINLSADLVVRSPQAFRYRLIGAHALFQLSYPNAALAFLKPLNKEQWAALNQQDPKLVELVALFQKQVPLNILPARSESLDPSQLSSELQNEFYFARGRVDFERGRLPEALQSLSQVRKDSRYYGPADYLKGSLFVKQKKYSESLGEFSKVFEPQVFQNSQEFWSDVEGGKSSVLAVELSDQGLRKGNRVSELSMLAMARVAYASKDYLTAIDRYQKISKESDFYERARLETLWALLSLNRHEDAQKLALEVANDAKFFEAVEARVIRALILTDAGHTEEARAELNIFKQGFDADRKRLYKYLQFPTPDLLPEFIKSDMSRDQRLVALNRYQEKATIELKSILQEDRRFYPVFGQLVGPLENNQQAVKDARTALYNAQVKKRIADLERLYIQCKLILAETYLEDREKMRVSFKGTDEKAREEYDRTLVKLLTNAVQEVDEAIQSLSKRNLFLDFRQSELLWELSTATSIIAQSTRSEAEEAKAVKLRERSIQIARAIADKETGFEKHAQAMFFSGFALLELGKNAEGSQYLKKYIELYPQHAHAADANRILGDIDFDANRFAQADSYYRKILEYPNSSVIGYALYKIGWCQYNLKNPAKGLLALEQAILWAKSVENADQVINLKREAKRDLIAIFSEYGDYTKALEYFERFAESDAKNWLAELAADYNQNGQYEKSTHIYRQILALFPDDPNRILYYTSILHGLYQLRKWDMVVEAADEFVMTQGAALEEPTVDKEALSNKAEAIFRETVLAQHFEFDKTDVQKDVERVFKLDEIYLKVFSKWPESQKVLYQYAHFLLKHQKMKESSRAFALHWEKYQATLKEPLREESLRNWIHTIEELEQDAFKHKKKDEVWDKLTDQAKKLLEVTGIYLTNYPKSKHARSIEYLQATLYFQYTQTAEGLATSQKIFEADPKDDFGKKSFKNLRVGYYELKDWKKTYDWATSLLQKPEIAASEFGPDLKTVREESLFLLAENTEDPEASAKFFQQIASEKDMKRLADKALHNAFIRFQKAGKRIEALQISAQLEKEAPTFKELPSIAAVKAAYYQEAGDYDKALPYFVNFLKAPPKEATIEAVQISRLSLGVILEALGQWPQAKSMYQQYAAALDPKDTSAKERMEKTFERLDSRTAKRKPASTYPAWDKLVAQRVDYEKAPLTKSKDLAQQITGGAQRLEKVLKAYFEVSSSKTVPPFYAFEAYCSISHLYKAYQAGVRKLGDGQPEDLKAELEKIVTPFESKIQENIQGCLEKTEEAFHEGPEQKRILKEYGWRKDSDLVAKVEAAQKGLDRGFPWVKKSELNSPEAEILNLHLQEKATRETWYSLASTRLKDGKMGLARLTALESLRKYSNDPGFLNIFAVSEQGLGSEYALVLSYYDKAQESGSVEAAMNLAAMHLRNDRLNLAKPYLKTVKSKLSDNGELVSAIEAVFDAMERKN